MKARDRASRILLFSMFVAGMWAGGTTASRAQDTPADSPRRRLQDLLDFEAAPQDSMPGGWRGGPKGTIFVDSESPHNGRQAVRLERRADSTRGTLPAPP